MGYKLKDEYKGMELNFPELRLKVNADDIDQNTMTMLIRKGHAGYFEDEKPIDLKISIDMGFEKKKDEEKVSPEPTASISTEAPIGGRKRGRKPKELA